jgi:hypothetical protein
MRTDDQPPPKTSKPTKRRRNYDFYYYEQVGSRIYFRVTWFGAISLMVLVVLTLAFFALYAQFTDAPPSNAPSNKNVTPPSMQATPGRLMRPVARPANVK